MFPDNIYILVNNIFNHVVPKFVNKVDNGISVGGNAHA